MCMMKRKKEKGREKESRFGVECDPFRLNIINGPYTVIKLPQSLSRGLRQ